MISRMSERASRRAGLFGSVLLCASGVLGGCTTPAGSSPDPSVTAASATPALSSGAPAASSAPSTESAAAGSAPAATATAEPAPTTAADSTSAAAAGTSALAAAPSGPCPAGMISIAAGTFRRRKPGERGSPTVARFCLDRTEVTVAAYKECVKEKKCSPRCLEVGRCTAVPVDADWPDKMETIRASMFCNGSRSDRDDHPVNCVSFDEAKGYCEVHGKRLPTGDEWEWAAVGDKPAPIFPWGARGPEGDELCWGKPYRRSLTCLPGTFPRDVTRDGVVDMAGNLSEWVTWTTPKRVRPQLRGASWYSLDDGYVQAAIFGFESTSSRSEVFGFRCAKDAPAP